jgi:hypothetical protein
VSIDALLSRLNGVQGRGPRYRAICPAHQSKNKSRTLVVTDAGDGRTLVHCFAGCDVGEVIGALGMELSDLMPERKDDATRPPREKRPWSVRDVAASLEAECAIAWLILVDLKAGKVITQSDRERAGLAAERCADLMRELAHAS